MWATRLGRLLVAQAGVSAASIGAGRRGGCAFTMRVLQTCRPSM